MSKLDVNRREFLKIATIVDARSRNSEVTVEFDLPEAKRLTLSTNHYH